MSPSADGAQGDGAAEAAARRRAFTAALATLGAFLIASALLCAGMRAPVRDQAVQRWGDYAIDDAIGEDGVYAQGLVMSRDAYGGGILLSYEYFHQGELFVGYQRVTEDEAGELALGDEVDVTLWSANPSHARIAGTRRAPEAERTRAVDRWLGVTSRLQWPIVFIAFALVFSASIRLFTGRNPDPTPLDDS